MQALLVNIEHKIGDVNFTVRIIHINFYSQVFQHKLEFPKKKVTLLYVYLKVCTQYRNIFIDENISNS